MTGIDSSSEFVDNRAFCTTHMRAVAEARPTPDVALSWIQEPRLKSFAATFDPFVAGGAILLGTTGLGKSLACFCVMRRIMLARIQSGKPRDSWASYDALDLGLEAQRTPLGHPEADAIERAKTSACLILDDLGWERAFHVDTIVDIAAARYKHGRPTLVTSGKTESELRATYGAAVLRRFTDVGGLRGKILDCWKPHS